MPKHILSLIDTSHSVFHVVDQMVKAAQEKGFIELKENKPWNVAPGKSYFLTRNGSSFLAFVIPENPTFAFRLTATHNDSPTFALKSDPLFNKSGYTMVNVEPYGGALYATWFDRPLSIAGRAFIQDEKGTRSVLVDVDKDLLTIPSLAIHQNREANNGATYNPATQLIPLYAVGNVEGNISSILGRECGIEGKILSFDLSLYVREGHRCIGSDGEFVLSPRLDDLSCAYAGLEAILAAKEKKEGNIPVFVSFDNEEVGSLTAQGANSDFLISSLRRLALALGKNEEELRIAIADSIMLSCDNAHAGHPNYPGIEDPTSPVKLNGGIVIKHNAAQRYTTSGRSAAYVESLASSLGQTLQHFSNRSDLRGGSTLGNISNAEVSLCTVDIGIAQLAMHSSVELCGVKDISRMAELLNAHFLTDLAIPD